MKSSNGSRQWQALFAVVVLASSIMSFQNLSAPLPTASASTSAPGFAVGARTLATPSSGARYIYVATNGTDFDRQYQAWYNGGDYKSYNRYDCLTDPNGSPWGSQTICTQPTIANPLRTIQLAMRVARPGDVIVVRGGTYAEALGWGIVAGSSTRPITMQARPGEVVNVPGTLAISNPHYWRFVGLRFSYNSKIQTGQAIVNIAGGTGWRFENNSVTGSPGVANVLVTAAKTTSTSSTALRAAAPNDFIIRGNCITDNRGTGTHGQYHNIYLMSTVYSTGGVIERNLLAGAPRGANIKAAAASPESGSASPKGVVIRDNTLLYAASGITVGLQTQYLEITGNLIALPVNETKYDGAVKTYQMSYAQTIGFKDSFVSGYRQTVEYDAAAPTPIYLRRVQSASADIVGSVSACTARASGGTAAQFGHLAP